MMNVTRKIPRKWEIRHRIAVRASFFAILVLSVLLAPSASALTVLPEGGGTTWIYQNGTCLAMVAVPPPDDDVEHTDGDDVQIPMRAEWFDYRNPSSQTLENWYVIDAVYEGLHYGNSYKKETTGGNANNHDHFSATVPDVETDTYMTIDYIAYVYNPSSGRTMCYDEGSTWFYFAEP